MSLAAALFLLLSFLPFPGPLHAQESDPLDLFSEAHTLFSRGDLSQAEELFRKTLGRSFVLEDYSLYFLGEISLARSELENGRHYASRLKQSFPQSVWSLRADLLLAKISLAQKDHDRAAGLLRSLRAKAAKGEIADEALYLLARTYESQGQWRQAYSAYQELRQSSPLTQWGRNARREVLRLRAEHPRLFALDTVEALSSEGEILFKEREYQEAEKAQRRILDLVPEGAQRPRHLMALANVYRAARKREQAIPLLGEILEKYPASREAPQALYHLALIYWNRDDNLKALDYFKQLEERYPQSASVDLARVASGRIYESLGRVDEARRVYQEIPKKFPSSRLRDEAKWRLAWLHYLTEDYNAAHAVFKELALDKGADRYRDGALYWQARSAEKIGLQEEARQTYGQILGIHNEGYYAGLAAERLEKKGAAVEEKNRASPNRPEKGRGPSGIYGLSEPDPSLTPHLQFHFSRAQTLAEISLHHLAVSELDAIRNLNRMTSVKVMLMREYARNKAYSSSVALAHEIPYPSDDLNRYRYPLAYWDAIRKAAGERDLDPYLVTSLIRQESLFDPKALSPASAYGLMQLLPSTAARTARELGLPPPQAQELFQPDLNLTLGIHHLRQLLQRYSQNPVRALAAYNAGEHAVARWERQIAAEDEEVFIERIPYAETRLYVKLVLRNLRIYRMLYPDPNLGGDKK